MKGSGLESSPDRSPMALVLPYESVAAKGMPSDLKVGTRINHPGVPTSC